MLASMKHFGGSGYYYTGTEGIYARPCEWFVYLELQESYAGAISDVLQ